MKTMTQVRPRPENTVDQINGGTDDEFSEMREGQGSNEGFLAGLAKLFGKPIEQVKAAMAGKSITTPDYPVTDCRECGKEFRIFEKHYGKKQVMCPACDDESMREAREVAMRPEKIKAERLARMHEAAEAQKKADAQREQIELVAQTVAQVLKNKEAKA